MNHEENIAQLKALLKDENRWLRDRDLNIEHLPPKMQGATWAMLSIKTGPEATIWLDFDHWQTKTVRLDKGGIIKIIFVKYPTA